MSTGIWVLTKNVNDYNQHGAYFVDAWTFEPSKTDLTRSLMGMEGYDEGKAADIADWIVGHGGGRQSLEHEWFTLEKHK